MRSNIDIDGNHVWDYGGRIGTIRADPNLEQRKFGNRRVGRGEHLDHLRAQDGEGWEALRIMQTSGTA